MLQGIFWFTMPFAVLYPPPPPLKCKLPTYPVVQSYTCIANTGTLLQWQLHLKSNCSAIKICICIIECDLKCRDIYIEIVVVLSMVSADHKMWS